MPVLYGIKNCDAVKKARAWLDSHHIEYRFHDYRVDGIDTVLLNKFIDMLGMEAVLKRRSTSWKNLTEEQKLNLTSEQAIQLMLEIPTLIKRPIYENGDKVIAGFSPEVYQNL